MIRAGKLLNDYHLDLVVANDLNRVSSKLHEAIFVGKENRIDARMTTKIEIAEKLSELITERIQ